MLKSISERSPDARVAYFPDWLEPVLGELTIVFGPPGSGKSTYVRTAARASDVVIDVDEIAATLSNLPIYQADEQWLSRAVYARNRMLSDLSRAHARAWLITTGRGEAERTWWQRKLKPTHMALLDEPAATCIARINADVRRPAHVKARHIAEVRRWWSIEQGLTTQARPKRGGLDADGWPL